MIMKKANPWLNLSSSEPYLLDIDEIWAREYKSMLIQRSSRLSEQSKRSFMDLYDLHLEDVPFPYYGDPYRSEVVVLQANPGHDPLKEIDPLKNDIELLNKTNLLHQNKIPLFSFQNMYRTWKYKNGTMGECWYWRRTRELREIAGWKNVANKLMYLELFPYRSKKLFYPKTLPPSQEYTFQLLREMLDRGVWVIVTRMKKQWLNNVPELETYGRLVSLNSSQNVTLSRRNIGFHFEEIADSLK